MKTAASRNDDRALAVAWSIVGLMVTSAGLVQRFGLPRLASSQLRYTNLTMDIPLILGLGVMALVFVRGSMVIRRQNETLADAQRQTARLAAEREAILRSITEAMMVTDETGRPIRANQAFTAMMGRMGDRRLGEEHPHAPDRHIPLFHDDGRAYSLDEVPVRRALRGEKVENELIVVKNGDQQNYYLCNWTPIRDPVKGAVSGTVALLRDVSGLKRLERLKDEFISTVSHELRTPLAVIKGYAELALLEPHPAERAGAEVVEPALRKIVTEVDLMSGLINQMLQIARLESDRMAMNLIETDLVEMVATEVSALTIAQTGERVRLDLSEAGGTLPILLDRSALRQILANLVSNAVKYSPVESSVMVSLRRAGQEALLSVADSGMGIPEDDLPLVFERFYRSENALKTGLPGLGLGLHITARLVRMLGGRITVESRQGNGSTFTVALPLPTVAQPGAVPATSD